MNLDLSNDKISQICKKYRVKRLSVFGSYENDDSFNKIDVHFLVAFLEKKIKGSFDRYFDLKEELEAILDKDVYLVNKERIRNPYFKKEIDLTKQLVYSN